MVTNVNKENMGLRQRHLVGNFCIKLNYYFLFPIDKAFTHFQQVLKLAPDHSKAKEAFKRARQLKTKKDEGNEAFKANKFEEASRLYSEALLVDSDNKISNAKLYFNRATVLAKVRTF